jgi:transcriptional regulatory protein RtcR
MAKKNVAIGLLGVDLDRRGPDRWDRWRPTIAMASHEDLLLERLELLLQKKFHKVADQLIEDLSRVSPETEVRKHVVEFADPWDFEQVYGGLADFADGYPFDPDREDYLVHMTTGTHVAQICLYLLTEARYIPGRLLQTSPPTGRSRGGPGSFTIIDLDLSKYDKIAGRFANKVATDLSFLKAGIDTRNGRFNKLIEQIEQVSILSRAPLLLAGPTGVGKSELARRIYQLKSRRRQVQGELVEVNCATLRGDAAMSALFGHVKGAFTGASAARSGLLRAADGGLLFLDEIGELGADEQAMLLRAIESKTFLPVGSDAEVTSDFQLIAGTNRDLRRDVEQGRFREDLLARINLWTFELPPLRERIEDIEPNLHFEVSLAEQTLGHKVAFSKEARDQFLSFATSARWPGNFRDFHAAVERMATLAGGSRISTDLVSAEIERLRYAWARPHGQHLADQEYLADFLDDAALDEIDLIDQAQLGVALRVCRRSASLSEAGRTLFAASRRKKRSSNDADRLRKLLERFGLDWKEVVRGG